MVVTLLSDDTDAELLAGLSEDPTLMDVLQRELWDAFKIVRQNPPEGWEKAERGWVVLSTAFAKMMRHHDEGPPYHPEEAAERISLLRSCLLLRETMHDITRPPAPSAYFEGAAL